MRDQKESRGKGWINSMILMTTIWGRAAKSISRVLSSFHLVYVASQISRRIGQSAQSRLKGNNGFPMKSDAGRGQLLTHLIAGMLDMGPKEWNMRRGDPRLREEGIK